MPDMLYLIDGHAQIFRAYYAIRGGMTSPVTGEATHAVFGFAAMLVKLFDQYRPSHVIMAVDMPGKTFRDEIYEHYKANREAPPDDFSSQVERIIEMAGLFGIPVIGVTGAEADDVIATCVQHVLDDPAQQTMQIRIMSRDKDLEQLLNDRVVLFDIHKGETTDVAALLDHRGIRPDQVIDVLALMGDNVDNIPGVDGIGPKTATKLIGEFGSIDGLLNNLDQVKGKRREKIAAATDRVALNRTLVTLKRDVDLSFDLAAATVGGMNAAALRVFFETMGFRRFTGELDRITGTEDKPPPSIAATDADGFATSLFASTDQPADTDGAAPVPEGYTSAADGHYRAITTRDDLAALAEDLHAAPLVSVDTETIGLGRDVAMCGLSFAWEQGTGVYVPLKSPTPQAHLDTATVLDALRPVLEDTEIAKCGHNLKYDALVLRHADVHLRGMAFDSMIAAQLLGSTRGGLDHLAAQLLKHVMIPIRDLIGDADGPQKTLDQLPVEQVTPYAAEDADIALRLRATLIPQLTEAGMAALVAVEMPLVEVLADMESTGIRVDADVLLEQKRVLTQRIDELRQTVFDTVGEPFNLDSPKQLANVLFNRMGLPVIKRKKTGPSTDVEVLQRLAAREDLPAEQVEVANVVVRYRQFSKLVNTYLDNLAHSIHQSDGRVHATFQQLGAATGRLSSGGPNLQNIPVRTDVGRQVRRAFVAAPGHLLICADYSQIELRILAHLSEDAALTQAFLDDMDIHRAVAAQVFEVAPDAVTPEQRNTAKIVNFGIIYGITPFGLSRRIEGLDRGAAAALIEDYRHRFPGIDRFMQQCVNDAVMHGYVTTILGRRRRIDPINATGGSARALGQRLAINTVVQGSATGDLIKLAMVNLYRRIQRDGLPLKLLVQIHDELLLEAPKEEAEAQAAIVREEMEQAMSLRVPLKVDIGMGKDWYSAK